MEIHVVKDSLQIRRQILTLGSQERAHIFSSSPPWLSDFVQIIRSLIKLLLKVPT